MLDLVHSSDVPDTNIGDKISQYAGDVIASSEKGKLEKFVSDHSEVLQKLNESQNVPFRIDQGGAYQCLIHEVGAIKAALIAIGSHSRPSFTPYRLGGGSA